MARSLFLGFLLVGMTVGIHAIGTTWWIRRLQQRVSLLLGPDRKRRGLLALIMTALWLFFLHLIETFLWASAYRITSDIHELQTWEEALYFSSVTLTTLGYGDITLTGPWRLLCGLEAMNGILLFGWSTALLFMVVQHLWVGENPHLISSPPLR